MPDFKTINTYWIVNLFTKQISIGLMTEYDMNKYRNEIGGIYDNRAQAEWRAQQNW